MERNAAQGLFGSKMVGDRQAVWMSHGDEVATLPDGFEVVARSQQGAVAAIENRAKRFYGLQYHPEVIVFCFNTFVIEVKLGFAVLGVGSGYILA